MSHKPVGDMSFVVHCCSKGLDGVSKGTQVG